MIQIGEVGIGFRGDMDFGDVGPVTVRKHLLIDAAAADDHGPGCGFRQLSSLLRAAAQGKAGNLRSISADGHIDPAGKGFLSREIFDGTPAGNHHAAFGHLPEEFTILGKGDGLGSVPADAPIVIYCYNQLHNTPQMAIGILKSNSWKR